VAVLIGRIALCIVANYLLQTTYLLTSTVNLYLKLSYFLTYLRYRFCRYVHLSVTYGLL